MTEKYSDPGFDTYVDLSQLQAAFLESDASVLVDVLLNLAEAERVLKRRHKSGVTADELMHRIASYVVRRADDETLERLRRASSRLNKEMWGEILTDAKEFASTSRAAVPNFNVDKLAVYKVMQMKTLVDAIHSAELHRQPKLFNSIQQEIEKLEGLSKSEKDYLLSELSTAKAYSQEHSEGDSATTDLLWELESASRGERLGGSRSFANESNQSAAVPADSSPQCCGASSSTYVREVEGSDVRTAKSSTSSLPAQESAVAFEDPAITPSESATDPAFERLVDLQLLGKAVNSNDIHQMIDILFVLAEREQVLQRTHRSGISASGLFLRIAGYAARHRDAEAISRLERGAVRMDTSDWTEQLTALREFLATQRSIPPSVPLSQVTTEKLITVASISRVMKWADLTGSQEALDRVESELAVTPYLSKAEKAFFQQRLNQVRQATTPTVDDVTTEVIREFASKSRGTCGTGWNEPWVRDSWGNANFSPACRAHDKCYEKCGASKRSCDDQFERDLRDICRRAYGSWVHRVQRDACLGAASKYALAVRRLGGDAYRDAQHLACRGTPGGTVPDVDRRTYRVDIVNPYSHPIHYTMNGEKGTVEGNRSRWHSRQGSPYFNIEFDESSATGYQSHRESLVSNRNYRFRWSGHVLRLDEDTNGGGHTSAPIRYTIKNDVNRPVMFQLPSGRQYTLFVDETGTYTNPGAGYIVIPGSNRGRYLLKSGRHRIWMMDNGKLGFDMN